MLSGGASQVPGGTTGTATLLLTMLPISLYVNFKKTVSRDKYFYLNAYTNKGVIFVRALIVFNYFKILLYYIKLFAKRHGAKFSKNDNLQKVMM